MKSEQEIMDRLSSYKKEMKELLKIMTGEMLHENQLRLQMLIIELEWILE